MRRSLLLSVAFGLSAVGVGCKAVGGRCDCGYSPAEAHLPTAGMAYPTIGSPVVGVTSVAPAAVAPAPAITPDKMPLPEKTDKGVAPAITPDKGK